MLPVKPTRLPMKPTGVEVPRPVFNFTGKPLEIVCVDGEVVVLEPVGELGVRWLEEGEDLATQVCVGDKRVRRHFCQPKICLDGEAIDELPEPLRENTICIVREEVARFLRFCWDRFPLRATLVFPDVADEEWHKGGNVRVYRVLSYFIPPYTGGDTDVCAQGSA